MRVILTIISAGILALVPVRSESIERSFDDGKTGSLVKTCAEHAVVPKGSPVKQVRIGRELGGKIYEKNRDRDDLSLQKYVHRSIAAENLDDEPMTRRYAPYKLEVVRTGPSTGPNWYRRKINENRRDGKPGPLQDDIRNRYPEPRASHSSGVVSKSREESAGVISTREKSLNVGKRPDGRGDAAEPEKPEGKISASKKLSEVDKSGLVDFEDPVDLRRKRGKKRRPHHEHRQKSRPRNKQRQRPRKEPPSKTDISGRLEIIAGINPISGYNPMPNGYNPMPNGYNPMPNGYNPTPNGYNTMQNGYNPMRENNDYDASPSVDYTDIENEDSSAESPSQRRKRPPVEPSKRKESDIDPLASSQTFKGKGNGKGKEDENEKAAKPLGFRSKYAGENKPWAKNPAGDEEADGLTEGAFADDADQEVDSSEENPVKRDGGTIERKTEKPFSQGFPGDSLVHRDRFGEWSNEDRLAARDAGETDGNSMKYLDERRGSPLTENAVSKIVQRILGMGRAAGSRRLGDRDSGYLQSPMRRRIRSNPEPLYWA